MQTRFHPSIWLTLWLVWLAPASFLQAQPDTAHTRFRVYTYQGETYMAGELEGVDITAPRPSERQLRRGRKRLARFTRLRYNVHKVYPYAVKVAGILEEVNLTIQNMPDDDERKAFIKSKEQDLFGEYEDDVRQMTRSQGRVLVKLVSRETGRSTFDLIKDNKSGASAIFWQSIGLIFGINLRSGYDQEEDDMIEQIVTDLERGGYNIAYKQYGFRFD